MAQGIRQEKPYMQTRGGKVDLYSPEPEVFEPYDIAYALSHLPRYLGNYGPYSVAQHAVNVAHTVDSLLGITEYYGRFSPFQCEQLVLAGLHHDDAEAILGDIPSPVKRELGDTIVRMESAIERAIEERLGLPPELLTHRVIKEADLIVFCAEVRIMVPASVHDAYEQDCGVPMTYKRELQPPVSMLTPWPQAVALREYMALHEDLFG